MARNPFPARHRPVEYVGALRHGFMIFSKMRARGQGPKKCRAFTDKALKKGMRVEAREHKLGPTWAKRIARDHLCSNPKYYARER